jgi:thiopurine S-methyltransferase
MHTEFWQSRWQRNDIGFHAREVNPMLVRHWSVVCRDNASRVLVPLCGKSIDLLWLANRKPCSHKSAKRGRSKSIATLR